MWNAQSVSYTGGWSLNKLKTWNDIFAPVRATSKTLEDRPQQEILGNGIIDALENKTVLLGNAPTGSGKSFAALVPLIDHVKDSNKTAVFSVTTLALQDQIATKDLPFLSSIYKNFTYAVLKGRGQYLCKNHMKENSIRNPMLNEQFKKVEGHSFATGERSEVEKFLGKLTDEEWRDMAGDAKRCGEYVCTETECFGAKARQKAVGKNIVVVNHSVLIANFESAKMGGGFLGEEGEFDTLVVDEAHELENSVISFLEEKVTQWEIDQWSGTIMKGVEDANHRGLWNINERAISGAIDDVREFLEDSVTFFKALAEHEGREWKGESTKLSKRVMSVRSPQPLKDKANMLYSDSLDSLFSAAVKIGEAAVALESAHKKGKMMDEERLSTISKAKNKANAVYRIVRLIAESADSGQGYALEFGVPYGIILNGYFKKRDGSPAGLISVTPLNVSEYCKTLFSTKTCVFLSATLKDLSAPEGEEFEYFVKSMGLEERIVDILDLEAVFDYSAQQLVYITNSKYKIESNRAKGVRYSLNELLDLINTAKGRTLVLFTSNKELEEALGFLSQQGLPYPIYAQGGSMSKQELVDAFMEDTNSILLGSKSFFTGVDFHGEACSLVVLVKFPNPRFDDLCRLRINWWNRSGYKTWYEREALSVFQQGAGRLIRKGDDFGVVAVLDKRAADPKERVHVSVGKGVTAMGSPVTADINDVKEFLGRGA